MKTLLLICLLCSLTVGNAQQPKHINSSPPQRRWPLEPQGFKNLKFGATLQEVRQLITLSKCGPAWNDPSIQDCSVDLQIGDYPVSCMLAFADNRLSMIMGRFSSEYFREVRDIFIELYGQPHESSEEALKWVGNQVSASLTQQSSVSRGTFMLWRNTYAARSDGIKKDAAKKAAKDL